jgi:hypothetical protein
MKDGWEKHQRSTFIADIKKNQSAYDNTCSLPGLHEHIKNMGG